MNLARRKPDEGLESALTWQSRGGGDAAEHCAAVALIGLGESTEAATRLEKLGTRLAAARPGLAAEILAQAGQAWLMAGKADRAYAVQTTALKLAPQDVGPSWSTVRSRWARRRTTGRRSTISIAPTSWRPSAPTCWSSGQRLPLRRQPRPGAGGYRCGDRARPAQPEAYLERGILRRLADDRDGARSDWMKTLALGTGTPTGDAAQKNLELLDLKAK